MVEPKKQPSATGETSQRRPLFISKETALTFIHRCAGREDKDTNKLE